MASHWSYSPGQAWPFAVMCLFMLAASLPGITVAQANCGSSVCSGGESCCSNQCCAYAPGTNTAALPAPKCCKGVCCSNPAAQSCANLVDPANGLEACCRSSRIYGQLPFLVLCCPIDLCITGGGYGRCCAFGGLTVCTPGGCLSPDQVPTVGGDPHISLPNLLPADQTNATEFRFDFHGAAGKSSCMITDASIAVNAHMFGLAPTALVPEHRYHGGRCFQFTWIDGIGFVYRNPQGQTQHIAVWLDRTLTDVSAHPFNVTFEGAPVETSEEAAWSSPDGIARIVRSDDSSRLVVSVDGLLEVELSRGEDAELRDEPGGPPVRYINLAVKRLVVSPEVHGFMGQMYAPGAVEARLKMVTQEGLNHREYVEGADEEYETSDLTSADCSFDRFGTAVTKTPALVRKLRSIAPKREAFSACSYSGQSFVCK